MTLTINSLIEALTNTDGRVRSLEPLRPATDEVGRPRFSMPGRGLVDFEIVTGGVPCTLRCPLRWDEEAAEKLRLIGAKSVATLPDWRWLGDEITIFTEEGEAVHISVLLRPIPPRTDSPQPAIPAALDPDDFEEFSWDALWGIAVTMNEGEWKLLDREGRTLTPKPYEWLGECSEGLILAQRDGKCGFLDTRGREAIPLVYDDATSFADSCALVTLDGRSFFIESPDQKTRKS